MTEGEIIKLIKQTVRVELAQTLLGGIQSTDNAYSTSVIRFASDSKISNLRLIRPYGFASRPPATTTTVVHPINADGTHLMTMGEFDEGNRPAIADSESAMYGSTGQVIWTSGTDVFIGDYVKLTGTFLPIYRAQFHQNGSFELGILKPISANAAGMVFIGKPSANNPLVLGDILQTFCTQLISILSTALSTIASGPIAITTTPGNSAPTFPAVVTALNTAVSQLTSLQSQYVASPATNFVSSTNFTTRIGG